MRVENGAAIDETMDYDAYLQQMLYYVAACKSRPVHITAIRDAFGIDDSTLAEASHGLVHTDALIVALKGALDYLEKVSAFLGENDLALLAEKAPEAADLEIMESLEAAEYRLIAAGQLEHADALGDVQRQLGPILNARSPNEPAALEKLVREVTTAIVTVKQDVEHKLQHGLHSNFVGNNIDSREGVASATFRLMGLVENHLHQILRRQALQSALETRPESPLEILALTTALQRYLNKTEQGHQELRSLVREVDDGEGDVGLLYDMAVNYLQEVDTVSEEDAIAESLQLLQQIADALLFSGLEREGAVMEQCYRWLSAANNAGTVEENDAFRCFADAFAHIEMHLQRSLIDPLDDTSHMLSLAESRAEQLEKWIPSPGRVDIVPMETETEAATEIEAEAEADEAAPAPVEAQPVTACDTGVSDSVVEELPLKLEGQQQDHVALVKDGDIPDAFLEVFVEESEEIVAELSQLTSAWLQDPIINDTLRDIRRHFHTFKGNGRAVGANILGELGWAAQDMLDRSLDTELEPDESIQKLVGAVVEALPDLVESYSGDGEPDIERIRELTRACHAMAAGETVTLNKALTY